MENNKQQNPKINLYIKDITNIDELKNLQLNIELEEGDINLSESNIMWKDDLQIKFKDSYLRFILI